MIENHLKRQENESFMDYHIRLFEKKDEYGIDTYKIAELLNAEYGSNYDESKWRKDYAQYKKWKDYILSKNLDKEILAKYEEIKREAEKKKIQAQDQNREYRKYLRLDARLDHILETIVKETQNLNKTKPLHWYNKNNYNNDSTKAGVLLASDWHKGLFTINYWNVFNDDEFYRRINRLTNKVVEYGTFHRIKSLHLFQIGDLIHGTLHRLTRIMDTQDAVHATMSVAETLSEMVSVFANEFEEVKVYSSRGNHDRVNSNKSQEISTESFNDIIPWFMKERTSKFDNVEIVDNHLDDEIIVADILGHTVFAVHGHKDNLNTIVSDLTLMIKQFPKYIFSGHIHKNYENEVHGIEHIVNSSLSGVDDFSKDIRKTSKPAQKFMIFDKDEGRLCTYNIQLGNK
jgi:Calcineurin-like phosphoesterase